MDRFMRHPSVQKTINHPQYKRVVNKRTIIWFTVIKLIIYVFTAGFFAINAMNANAANGLPENITQVKLADQATVYYLDHKTGQKKAYADMVGFRSYGNSKKNIKIISSDKLKKWADYNFIKAKGGFKTYFIKGKFKSPISKTTLDNLNLDEKQVLIVNAIDFLSYKTISNDRIGFAQADMAKLAAATPSASANNRTVKDAAIYGVGGDDSLLRANKLAIELVSTETQEYLPAGSSRNLLATYRIFTKTETVNVRGLLLDFSGVFSPSAISKITAELPERNLIFESALNNRQAHLNFGPSVVVAPGSPQIIHIYADIASGDFTNQSLSVSINQGESVLTDLAVGGRFPIKTPDYKLANATGLLGRLKVGEEALSNANLIFGADDTMLAKFTVTETSGDEDVLIKQITIRNQGNLTSDAISNLKLRDNLNNTLGTASTNGQNEIIFNGLNYKLKKNQVRTLALFGSVVSGEDRASNFNVTRVIATGLSYGYNVNADISTDQTAYAIKRLNLAVESADLLTTAVATKRQPGTVIGNFRIKNATQNVKLDRLYFTYNKNSSAPEITTNLFLVNYMTGEVIDNQPAGRSFFEMKNLTLKPNEILKVAIIATLADNVDNNDSYWINMENIAYRYQDNNIYTDKVAIAGNVFHVLDASLYAFGNSAQPASEMTAIRGKKQAKIASFLIEAADSVDVMIKNISLKQGPGTDARMLGSTGFSNIKLSINSSAVSKTIAMPTSDHYMFDQVNYKLRAGQKAEIKVYADISKNANIDELQLAIDSINAINTANNMTAKITGTGAASNKTIIGNLAATVTIKNSGGYVPGIANNKLGTFEIANTGAEEISLKNITLINRGQIFSSANGFYNLRLVKAESTNRLGSIAKPVAEVNKVSLSGTKIKVGDSITVDVFIDAKNTAPSANSDLYINQIEISGMSSSLKTSINGDASGAMAITAGASANPTGLALAWPVSSHKISYGFHDPKYPFISSGEHPGIDIITSQGSSVYAVAAGEIIDVAHSTDGAYNYVTIKHSDGLASTYGHLSRIDVKIGDTVKSHQKIGLSGGRPGTTGSGPYTTGAHLHFEVTKDGGLVNPMIYLN